MSGDSPQSQLGRMITGYWISQAIFTAAKFGLADLLREKSRSVDELAKATETKPEFLYRLLRHWRVSAFSQRTISSDSL